MRHLKQIPLSNPVPEAVAATFDLSMAPAYLSHFGVLLLRQCIPLELIEHWLPRFEAGFAAADAAVHTGTMSVNAFKNIYSYGHAHPEYIPGYRQWPLALLEHTAFRQLLGHCLGDAFALMWQNAYPRRQGQYREHAIDWHRDTDFLGPVKGVVNTWIPMTQAGGDFPGLEFVCFDGQHWSPQMQPGDLLLFHCTVRHRTQINAAPHRQSPVRLSSELRWIPETEYSLTRSWLYHVPPL